MDQMRASARVLLCPHVATPSSLTSSHKGPTPSLRFPFSWSHNFPKALHPDIIALGFSFQIWIWGNTSPQLMWATISSEERAEPSGWNQGLSQDGQQRQVSHSPWEDRQSSRAWAGGGCTPGCGLLVTLTLTSLASRTVRWNYLSHSENWILLQ